MQAISPSPTARRCATAAVLASAALAVAALALAAQRPVPIGYVRSAPGAEQMQAPAGAAAFKGDATTGPFATTIIPAGTVFDGTQLWVVTSPNPGVIELHPGGATTGPFPAGGRPGIPFTGIGIWVPGFNGETGLNPRRTTPGLHATRIIPAGTAFDGTHLWVVTSPEPGVIELHPGGTAAGPFPASGGPPGIALVHPTRGWSRLPPERGGTRPA